jgi:predicted acylesterase/phospholipase RssA
VGARYWYGAPGVVKHWFCGVFEGGGAKGVAYAGALQAMAEQECWFSAVAGASAGAITAALVASGASPDEIAKATSDALAQVQTGLWAGLGRLQRETGYFPSDTLRAWLGKLLAQQLAPRGETGSTEGVTFRELWDATGIELNVIAADLSTRSQVVFSHLDTPNCVVADAVVASSSIPFAFSSRLLRVPDADDEYRCLHHTIVDGGVWSNFPMFVFEDRAFRRAYERVPEEIASGRVLGFILAEGDEQTPPRGQHVTLVDTVPRSELRAKERTQEGPVAAQRPAGAGTTIATWLLYPFSLLGRFVEWNGLAEPGRWPAPRSRLVGSLVHSVSGLLGGIHPLLFATYACALVAVGAWHAIRLFVGEQLRVIPATDWTHPISYVARPLGLLLALLFVAVAILAVFASVLAAAANWLLLRALRRLLYGLVTTYVTGPGMPGWLARHKGNVVALPIPPTVRTLSFRLPDKDRESLLNAARHATLVKLAEVVPRG